MARHAVVALLTSGRVATKPESSLRIGVAGGILSPAFLCAARE